MLLLLSSCNRGDRVLPADALSSAAFLPSTVMRLPRDGGGVELFRIPSLTKIEWKVQGALPPLRRAIGADLDQGLVFLADAKNQVVALDLETGKVRTWAYLSGVRDATIGPDGALYTVDDQDSVTQILRRTPLRFPAKLPGRPRDLFGTGGDQLLAVFAGDKNRLAIVGGDQPIEIVTLPKGDAAATFWGDLVAVAADTAVILYEPRSRKPLRSLRVPGNPRSVIFSPSGHRLYVATRDDRIRIVDRFSDELIGKIDLPGPGGALRPDPYGRWLLVHPPEADSVWVVDLAAKRFAGSWASQWGAELPTVAGQHILLVKRGADVVAFDLSKDPLIESGRIRQGARDLWLPVAWTPEPRQVAEAADSTEEAATDSAPAVRVYLQLSSSQNPAWAEDLSNQLKEAGLPATVLAPKPGEEGYRVVLGPYASRDEAEDTGRKLGRPFFLYQP